MIESFDLKVTPAVAANPDFLKALLVEELEVRFEEINEVRILRRSIDARKEVVKINLKVDVYINEEAPPIVHPQPIVASLSDRSVAIIGAGPAGMFAALKLLEKGVKPVIFERGKDIRERRRDLVALNREHIVNPDSNYCFGEGGAGTYSDGKLYTRSKKRGSVQEVLQHLVAFGANPEILVDAQPHIGTNKLPEIIANIREYIIEKGGVFRFSARVTDLHIEDGRIHGLSLEDGAIHQFSEVILATGHSARDIYRLLEEKNILQEFKSFALGVRVEHPQDLIDQIQYHCNTRGEYLPAASYRLVKQVEGRGVYSFCMCPGGIVAPCATAPGEVVTNGWSPSKRNMKTANSGIVVELKEEDFEDYRSEGVLAGMAFQTAVEKACWEAAGKTQAVPAQRLLDFIEGKKSIDLPESSYVPGIVSVDLTKVLPDFIVRALQKGFTEFGKMMKGYATNDAVVHAPESRSSSPLRIPRVKETMEHVEVAGLYPCGEGAGYAGGIVSAAIDGMLCAEKATERIAKR